jgi:hypothetical protein
MFGHDVVHTCTSIFIWFRYRVHQKNKQNTKIWYRCVSRFTVGCKSTVVFDVKSQEIVKLTNQHTHAPPVMEEIARYISFGCKV